MFTEPTDNFQPNLGGLDTDTDLKATKDGVNPMFDTSDALNCLNMRLIETLGNKSFKHNVIRGNRKVISLGTVTEQLKSYRIDPIQTFSSPTSYGFITIYSPDRATVLYQSAFAQDITGYTVNQIQTWINSEVTGFSGDFSTTNGSDYIDIFYADGVEWYLSYTVNGVEQSLFPLTEYIPASQAGDLTPNGSKQINENLYIFSANKESGGVGEIGVMRPTTIDEYEYIPLLRSKEFNFGWLYLVDVDGEESNDQVRLYFDDNNNVGRVFYYNKPFVDNGALNFNSSNNYYFYDKIANELAQQSYYDHIDIAFVSQTQTGGNLLSGNWRYAIVPVTNYGTTADPTPLSNIIPVYAQDTGGDPFYLQGDYTQINTSKINNLSIGELDPQVFPFFYLIAVNYSDNNVAVAYQLGKYVTDSSGTTSISHTGFEVYSSYATANLNVLTVEILKALNIRIMETRLVRSNLVEREQVDLTDAVSNLLLTAAIQEIDSEGAYINTVGSGAEFGGYFDQNNCYNYLGYMTYETYRLGIRGKYLDGSYTPVYWIADKTINPSDWGGDDSLTTEYVAAPSDVKLKVRKLVVTGWAAFYAAIDIDFSNQIEGWEIMRADCINEVLCCGLLRASGYIGVGTGANGTIAGYDYYGVDYEWPLSPVVYNDKYVTLFSPELYLSNNLSINQQGGDYLQCNDVMELISDDLYKLASTKDSHLIQYSGYLNGATASTHDVELTNTVNLSTFINGTSGVQPTNASGEFTIDTNTIMQPMLFVAEFSGVLLPKYYNYCQNGTLIMRLDAAAGFSTHVGIYGRYIRPANNKYGNTATTVYKSCNAFQLNGSTADLDVYGGDTFISRMEVKEGTIKDTTDGLYHTNAYGFFSEARINVALRNTNGGGQFGIGGATWNDQVGGWLEQPDEQTLQYADFYNPNNLNAFAAFDVNNIPKNHQPTRIRWSESKPIGSSIDYYCSFLPLNFIDLMASFGSINAMEVVNKELVTWQRTAFLRQFFNNTSLIPEQAGTFVAVGDSSVLGRPAQQISNIGTLHKWSVQKGRSAGGNDTLYWVNTDLKKIVRFGYDGTVVLSDSVKFRTFPFSNLKVAGLNDTTMSGFGATMYGVWDERHKEYVLTVYARKYDSGTWDNAVSYVTGNSVYYNDGNNDFNNFGNVYVALQNSLNKQPDTNPLFWEKKALTDTDYYSYFTVAFSEVNNRFDSFYTPKARLYMPYMDTYLTASPVSRSEGNIIFGRTSDVSISDIYINDEGDPLIWYGGTNGEGTGITSISGNTFLGSGFLDFFTNSQAARYKILYGTSTYYCTSITDTVITVERIITETFSTSDFEFIVCQAETAYRTSVFNPSVNRIKRLMSLCWSVGDYSPLAAYFTTSQNQQSFLLRENPNNGNLSDFDLQGEKYIGTVRNDTTLTDDNTAFADQLYGYWYTCKTEFQVNEVNGINSIEFKGQLGVG